MQSDRDMVASLAKKNQQEPSSYFFVYRQLLSGRMHTYPADMANSNPDINRLCRECIKGNTRAFKEIYESFAKVFFGICLRYAGDRVEAQDFLQDGFVKIFENLASFDPSKGSFYAWGGKIMVNTILMEKRKKRIETEEIAGDVIQESKTENQAIEQLSYAELVSYLQKLPEGYRTIFNLYAIEEYTHAEIAALTGISVSTSKTQFMKAKKMLSNLLKENAVVPTTA